jgi:hypothetical protein
VCALVLEQRVRQRDELGVGRVGARRVICRAMKEKTTQIERRKRCR